MSGRNRRSKPRERRQPVLDTAGAATVDHEASKMWWMRIIISIPMAMAVQKPMPDEPRRRHDVGAGDEDARAP